MVAPSSLVVDSSKGLPSYTSSGSAIPGHRLIRADGETGQTEKGKKEAGIIAAAASQSQQAPPPSAEEEALKRNTDCVYFLASPLTCKKGSECEYRHSEYARVNPRDCYYWLNGNCLNPKCGFRHPPLDGLLGNQVPISAAPSLTPSQAVTPSLAVTQSSKHASQGSGKQAVPCIFFQKGFCLKGDRCAFSHETNPTSNKVLQPTAPNSGSEPQPGKKAFNLQSCTQEVKIPQPKISKSVDPPQPKPAVRTDAPPRIDVGTTRNVPPPKAIDDEVPKYKGMISPLVVNGNTSRSNHIHVSQVADVSVFHNGKDGDEPLRDSSPGFDVLVDDDLRDSDYYHGDDQYGGTGDHEGRNLNSVDEYELGHSTDYNSMGDLNLVTRHDPLGYDSYEHMQGQYVGDQRMASSERIPVGPARLDRRGRMGSPESTDEMDLRHHLVMQRRRSNGLRSVVSPDFVPDSFVEERGYRGSSQRESHRTPLREGSISSRLRGRLSLPVRSADNGSDFHGEMDRGRNSGKLSPGRSHTGRFRDRPKDRMEEEHHEGRNLSGRIRREIMDGSSDFSGPKRLAELKVGKSVEGGEQQSLRKRKYSEDCQPSEGSLSFKGPLSLAEILKRKRETGATACGGVIASTVNVVAVTNNSNEGNKDGVIDIPNNVAVTDAPTAFSSSVEEDKKDKAEFKSATAAECDVDIEDGMIVDQGAENNEYEGDAPREEEYEDEQVDEGDYNNEEGGNIDAEEEYADDEDDVEEDDFAKKIGVMFS